jgi:hypothetical protein
MEAKDIQVSGILQNREGDSQETSSAKNSAAESYAKIHNYFNDKIRSEEHNAVVHTGESTGSKIPTDERVKIETNYAISEYLNPQRDSTNSNRTSQKVLEINLGALSEKAKNMLNEFTSSEITKGAPKNNEEIHANYKNELSAAAQSKVTQQRKEPAISMEKDKDNEVQRA